MPIKTTLIENKIAEEIKKERMPGLSDKRFEVEIDPEKNIVYVRRNMGLGGPDMSFKFTEKFSEFSAKVSYDVSSIKNEETGKVDMKIASPDRVKAIEATTIMDATRIMNEVRPIADKNFFKRLQH
jgi:hypothetical protein